MSENPSTRKLVPADSARQRSCSDGLAMRLSGYEGDPVSGAATGSSKGNDFDATVVGMDGMYAAAWCSTARDIEARSTAQLRMCGETWTIDEFKALLRKRSGRGTISGDDFERQWREGGTGCPSREVPSTELN